MSVATTSPHPLPEVARFYQELSATVVLDKENALSLYLDHFGLTQEDLNQNGAQTTLVQAAVIRDVTQGIIPQRQNITGRVPFNLMKSEQLVWGIDGVDYLETVVRRERQGTSHGVSIRVARGLYYSPRQFRSRPTEWEETVLADTGLLGLTTKHIYFAGSLKKFRVRYDRIVSFNPYEDGFGIMRDAQTARPSGPGTAGSPTTWRPTWPRTWVETQRNGTDRARFSPVPVGQPEGRSQIISAIPTCKPDSAECGNGRASWPSNRSTGRLMRPEMIGM